MQNTHDTINDCTIIGSGPAGYTAAIYAARAGMKPLLIEGLESGGQLTTTTVVENFPGFPAGIDGTEFMTKMREQAERFGTKIVAATVENVDFGIHPLSITLENGYTITTRTVIIATGATAKYLGLDDEQKYRGSGVSACATCDGFFYRNKDVAVVGGGDTACEEAIYLSSLANKVYMIVRKPFLRASQLMQQRVTENPKIEILYNTNTVGLFGDNGVEGAHLVSFLGEQCEKHFDINIDGFFLAIGHKPNSELFSAWLETDEQGYIITCDNTTATKIEGVFAAGDVADPRYRQAVTAAASGCRAALDAEKYLNVIKP